MAENLKSTTYSDGKEIPPIFDKTKWNNNTGPGYCYYEGVSRNKETFGVLYNYLTVSGGKLCPNGWHVATDADWSNLIKYVGGKNVAGEKLKNPLLWDESNGSENNEFGFSSLSGGYRAHSWYRGIYKSGYWWSVIDLNTATAWRMSSNSNKISRVSVPIKTFGYSVRCVKDN